MVANGWILTAAHLTKVQLTAGGPIEDPSAITFGLNGQSYTSNEWITYPGFDDNNIAAGIDLALIHVTGDLSSVTPVTRYTGTAESGATGTIVGYGFFGTGADISDGNGGTIAAGSRTRTYGTKRAGNNAIDSVSGNVLGIDFDPDPSHTATNVMGSSTALPLEYMPVFGDSGGAMFINDGGVTKLAGVVSYGMFGSNNQSGTPNLGKYGDSAFFVRVSQFNSWIDDQISADCHWNNSSGGRVFGWGQLGRRECAGGGEYRGV